MPPKRLTITAIRQRLIDGDRTITLLSYGKNAADNSSRWKCHDCGHEWNSSANNITNKDSGCPNCANRIPLTFKVINNKLINDNRPVILLSYGTHTHDTSSRWQCLDCGHEWNTSANSLLKGTGCSQCTFNRRRITAKDIEQRLINDNRPIILLSYGIEIIDTSSRWQCLDCGHEWNTSANSIINGNTGCNKCSTKRTSKDRTYTIEDVKQRLIDDNRPITVVSYGENNKDKSSLWKCHECDHEWPTSGGNILNGKSGCPACAGKIPLTLASIQQRLIDDNRPITLLSYGVNCGDNTSLWKCHECDYEWPTSYDCIHSGNGCPSCAGSIPYTLDIIRQKLIDTKRTISILNYGGKVVDNTSLWKCHECDYEWNTSVSAILTNKTGCPSCRVHTPDSIRQILIDDNRTISLLSYGKNGNDNSTLWKCHKCDYEWNATASNVLNIKTGCPHCSKSGFDSCKPAHFYLHVFNNFIKIGITNRMTERYNKLNNQTINGITYSISESQSWYFKEGSNAAIVESMVLDDFKDHQYTELLESSFDGKTELLDISVYDDIVALMKEVI